MAEIAPWALWVGVAIGSAVQGITGFGLAVIGLPLLMLAVAPRPAVGIILLLNLALSALTLVGARRNLPVTRIRLLAIGSLLGIPFGLVLLNLLAVTTLKAVVAALLLLFLLLRWLRPDQRLPDSRPLAMLVGVVSGALQSSTGLGPPPVALYLRGINIAKAEFRSVMAGVMVVSCLGALLSLAPYRVLTAEALRQTAGLMPAALVGFAIGVCAEQRVSPKGFARLASMTIAAAAVLSLVAAFG